MDAPGHDVLGNARPGIAIDRHIGMLVHAGAVVADVAVDGDVERRVEPGRQRMQPARVPDEERAAIGVMQPLVDVPDLEPGKIEHRRRPFNGLGSSFCCGCLTGHSLVAPLQE